MKFIFYIFIGLIAVFNVSLFAQKSTSNPYIKIGILEAFWRFQPVIGRWLSGGQGMMSIPDYMEKTSFSYVKRSYEKEVPFADSLTVVRLLGGWDYRKKPGELNGQKDADLVYVKQGKLYYRWDLLKKRLDPYILAGYRELTLVLDNIPWGLPKKPKLGNYGQVSPPYKLKNWELFLESMMQELLRLYGYDIVKNFRFRLGTECQHKIRFNGTNKEYIDLYLSTQKAIHKVLPKARIAPFNHGGGKTQLNKNNVDMSQFISLMVTEPNAEKPKVDFLPVSTYFAIRKKHKKNIKKLLDVRMEANCRYFNILSDSGNKKFPKEIHEFGILNNTLSGVRSNEPGVRGAAWRMYMIQNMMENNISRLYHWKTFDRVAKDKYLLKGNGWIYTVLDRLAGGEAYSLPSVTEENFHHKTLLVKKDKKVYLLTTAFPDRKDDSFKKNMTITVPLELFDGMEPINIRWTYLTRNTSVLDRIHSDFLSKNILDFAFLTDTNIISTVKSMGRKIGTKYVLKHWDKYTKIIIDSLTLKHFDEKVKKYKGGIKFNINMNIPSVSIIELTF